MTTLRVGGGAALRFTNFDLVGGEITTAGEFSVRPLGGFAVEYDKRADQQSQAGKIQNGRGFDQGTDGEDPHTADRLPPLQCRLEV